MEKKALKEIFGCLPKALLINFILGALSLLLGIAFGAPKIYITEKTAKIVFGFLFFFYSLITFWSIFTLKKYRLRENLVVSGPYKFIRHPMYSAIVFLLNPALGFFFRSWPLLLCSFLLYFVWKKCLKSEDLILADKFGEQWRNWQWQTGALFPQLWKINKPLFFIFWGTVVFLTAFVILNFPALYLRWAQWEENETNILPNTIAINTKIENSISNKDESQITDSSLPLANNNFINRENSIIISRLDIDAPLVFAKNTTQKELNLALNQGVVIYPGSALPGQNGEVFLTGHSSTYIWNKTPYGQIFALLDKLQPGDIVSLIFQNHQYNYKITNKEILSPNAVKLSNDEKPTLTLMTCWPVGTIAKRLLVRGELIK